MKREKFYIFRQVLLYAILLIPNVFVAIYSVDLQGSFFKIISYLLLSISLWLCIASFFSQRVFFCIAGVFLLLSPMEIVVVKLTGTPISIGFIDALFTTNYIEAKEQILSNKWLYFPFLIIVWIYIFQLVRVPNSFYPKKLRIIFVVVFFVLNIGLFVQMIQTHYRMGSSSSLLIGRAFYGWKGKYYKIYPSDLFLNVFASLDQKNKAKEMEEKLKGFSFDAKKVKFVEGNEQEVVVLMIGESARYGQLGINGYHRQTTPFLSKISDLQSFTNVYSQASLTSISVPQIITRATPDNPEIQFKEKTVIEAFAEAGFYTAIIGNQGDFIPIIKRLKNRVDTVYFSNQQHKVLDENILPKFDEFLSINEKYKFIMIHTQGSHFVYNERYPFQFEKFKPVISKAIAQSYNIGIKSKAELINSYDNSILYTDFIISQLINSLKSKNINATFLYVSDHGENLYDNNDIIGHGSEYPTKYEIHIPLLLWMSEKSIIRNRKEYDNLLLNKNKKATTDAVFYTLLDLGGISVSPKYHFSNKSLASEKYQEPKKRKVTNVHKKVIEIRD